MIVKGFMKALPGVLGTLLHRLAPESVDYVAFTGIYPFAMRVMGEVRATSRLNEAAQAQSI